MSPRCVPRAQAGARGYFARLEARELREKRLQAESTMEAAIAMGDAAVLQEAIVAAQEARRIMDRMSGFGWSGVMRQVIGGGASGGPVQSPTTRRLVERERERIRFISADYCSLTASVFSEQRLLCFTFNPFFF